jgi:4,5-dihydroxyphthalate decarboxylase
VEDASAVLNLTYAGLSYFDRTLALELDVVRPEGIDLSFVRFDVTGDLFKRQRKYAEFDCSEMSLSNFIMMVAEGDERFVGLPVFPSRQFRHKDIYVYGPSGIENPSQLKGKDVGVLQYQMTAAVWIRGILAHEFSVFPEDMIWWTGGLTEANTPAGDIASDYEQELEKLRSRIPRLSIAMIPGDRTLEDMLFDGSLQALITSRPPHRFPAAAEVLRLFPTYKQVEQDFYRRTGLFPIMHLVVVKRDVYERAPWIAASLTTAFAEAKNQGLKRLRSLGTLAVSLPWLAADLDEVDALFSGDAFPYGVKSNRTVLETTIAYMVEQGLLARSVRIEELFAYETLQ